MELNENMMNEKLLIEWLGRYSALSDEEKEIFLNIKRLVQDNLEIFYTMNRIIVRGEGEFRDDNLGVQFNCYNNCAMLDSSYGSIRLEDSLCRRIISVIIDIYEKIYPLGTVVDLKKEYYRGLFPVDNMDHIRVVIQSRFIECLDTIYVPYVGIVYPIGNVDTMTSVLHFTPKAIENVVHMGYSDDEEIAYLFQKKNELLLENNKHSTAFATLEELKMLQGV